MDAKTTANMSAEAAFSTSFPVNAGILTPASGSGKLGVFSAQKTPQNPVNVKHLQPAEVTERCCHLLARGEKWLEFKSVMSEMKQLVALFKGKEGGRLTYNLHLLQPLCSSGELEDLKPGVGLTEGWPFRCIRQKQSTKPGWNTPFVIATAGTRRQLQVEVELFDVCKLLNILL